MMRIVDLKKLECGLKATMTFEVSRDSQLPNDHPKETLMWKMCKSDF